MRNFLFGLILTVFVVLPSSADKGEACGSAPPMVDKNLRVVIDGKAALLLKSVADVNFKTEVTNSRNEILSKYPNADQALINNRFYYTTCYLLMNSKKSDDEKIRGLKELRREILGKKIYTFEEKLKDRIAVYRFIEEYGNFSGMEVRSNSCQEAKRSVTTSRFSLADGKLDMMQKTQFSTEQCDDIKDVGTVFKEETFSAKLTELNGRFDIGDNTTPSRLMPYVKLPKHATRIILRCHVGECISTELKREGGRFPNKTTSELSPALQIFIDSDTASEEFKEFSKSLSRLIDESSQPRICGKYSELCH